MKGRQILEIDKLGFRRLHSESTFKARLAALRLEPPNFEKADHKDYGITYFRVATGIDLKAKPAMPNGAWGNVRTEKECPVCKGTRIDQAIKVLAQPCWRCGATGFLVTVEPAMPVF